MELNIWKRCLSPPLKLNTSQALQFIIFHSIVSLGEGRLLLHLLTLLNQNASHDNMTASKIFHTIVWMGEGRLLLHLLKLLNPNDSHDCMLYLSCERWWIISLIWISSHRANAKYLDFKHNKTQGHSGCVEDQWTPHGWQRWLQWTINDGIEHFQDMSQLLIKVSKHIHRLCQRSQE